MASPINGFQVQFGTEFDVFESGSRHARERGFKTCHIAVPGLSDEGLASGGPVR